MWPYVFVIDGIVQWDERSGMGIFDDVRKGFLKFSLHTLTECLIGQVRSKRNMYFSNGNG